MKGFVTFFSFKTTTQKCFLSFGHYVYMIRTVGKYRVHSSKLGSSFKSKVWLSRYIIYERFKQILSTDLGFHCYIRNQCSNLFRLYYSAIWLAGLLANYILQCFTVGRPRNELPRTWGLCNEYSQYINKHSSSIGSRDSITQRINEFDINYNTGQKQYLTNNE